MAIRTIFTPITIVILLLALLAAYLFVVAQRDTEKRERDQTVPVRVQIAEQSNFRDVIEALGTARANESIVVTAQSQDLVEGIYFDDGDAVEAGQVLVELDSREERARLKELEFRLAEAKRQSERLQSLVRENVASRQALEEQDVLVGQIAAELEVAETRLATLKIRAPFAGRLGIRQVSLGSLIGPGDEITTLDDVTPIKVDFDVPELYFASLSEGQTVIAHSGVYPDMQFEGKIQTVNSRVDQLTRSILVRAIVDNQDDLLRPGMLLRVSLQRSVDEALMLPEKALIPISDRQYVYIVDDENRAVQTQVTIGRRQPGLVEITSGVELGQRVITEGIVRLRDGVPVAIRED